MAACINLATLNQRHGGPYHVCYSDGDPIHDAGHHPWLFIIPGKDGRILPYGRSELCVETSSPRVAKHLSSYPHITEVERTGRQITIAFDPGFLETAARAIKAS